MEKALQVYLPFEKKYITQKFAANANYSYARDGLKGHTAYDWGALWNAVKKAFTGAVWGAPIPNCVANAYCYSNMHENDPILMNYRAVFFLVETEEGIYEVSYGHLSRHAAIVGRTYQVGETIGYVGNTGDCFQGDHEVTEAEKRAGSHDGAHLHGPQIRPVKHVSRRTKSDKWYLKDANGYLKIKGFFFEVLDYDNGYNGCESLAPYSTETVATLQALEMPVAPTFTQETVVALQSATDAIQSLPVSKRTYFLEIFTGILRSFGIK